MSDATDPGARTEALINLADRLASQPLPPPEPRRWPRIAAGALLVVIIVLGIAALVGRGDGGDDAAESTDSTLPETGGTDAIRTADGTTPQAAPGPAPETSVADAPAATEPVVVGTTAPVPATPDESAPDTTTRNAATGSSAGASSTTTAPTSTVASSPIIERPIRYAEFTGGKVYLRGRVPDQATADEIRAKATAVVGEGNVVVEYDIVPGTPVPSSAPLYVRDSVLFARGSAAITDASRAVLDLGIVLMTQNPQVTMDIQGHTDSDGTEESNFELSQERVGAIFDYFVENGVGPERLTTHAFGEIRPIADNATAEGRAKNRRVEVTINDLIG